MNHEIFEKVEKIFMNESLNINTIIILYIYFSVIKAFSSKIIKKLLFLVVLYKNLIINPSICKKLTKMVFC